MTTALTILNEIPLVPLAPLLAVYLLRRADIATDLTIRLHLRYRSKSRTRRRPKRRR